MQRHDLDPVSLIAGLLFVLLGGAFLLDAGDVLDISSAWVLPTVLIGLGLGALAASRRAT